MLKLYKKYVSIYYVINMLISELFLIYSLGYKYKTLSNYFSQKSIGDNKGRRTTNKILKLL